MKSKTMSAVPKEERTTEHTLSPGQPHGTLVPCRSAAIEWRARRTTNTTHHDNVTSLANHTEQYI